MRKQYHLRPSRNGYFAWDVDRLIELTKDFDVIKVSVQDLLDKNEFHWFRNGDIPTSRDIFDHMKLVNECSLEFPIIISADGVIMDGMHRIGKAYVGNLSEIEAVKFGETPQPDFVDIDPEELPYSR